MENQSPLDSINLSNLELYKSQSKDYRHALNKIFFTCLKEIPKEILIEGLKKKKIIEKDWVNKKYIINNHPTKQTVQTGSGDNPEACENELSGSQRGVKTGGSNYINKAKLGGEK